MGIVCVEDLPGVRLHQTATADTHSMGCVLCQLPRVRAMLSHSPLGNSLPFQGFCELSQSGGGVLKVTFL